MATDEDPKAAVHGMVKTRRWQFLFWAAAIGTIVIIAYSAGRLVQGHKFRYLPLTVGDDLKLQPKSIFEYGLPCQGLSPGLRLTAIDKAPVQTYDDYQRALRHHGNPLTLRWSQEGSSGENVNFVWSVHQEHPRAILGTELEISQSVLHQMGVTGRYRLVGIGGELICSRKDADALLHPRAQLLPLSLESTDKPRARLEVAWLLLDERIPWLMLVASLSFGLLGAVAFWLKPYSRSAWAFFLTGCFTAVYYAVRAIPFTYRHEWEKVLMVILQSWALVPIIYFLGTFSPLRSATSFLRLGLRVASLLGLGLFLLWQFHFYTTFFWLWAGSILLVLVIVLPADYWFNWRGRELDAVDRQRAMATRLAIMVAFIPVTLYTILYPYLRGDLANFSLLLTLAPLLFPLIISYAIVRYNLLAIEELLIEGLAYGGFATMVGLVYALFAAVILPRVAETLPINSEVASGILIFTIAFLAYPLLAWIHRLLERRYEKAQTRYDDLIDGLKSIVASVTSRDGFAAQLVERLSRVAGAPAVSLLAGGPGAAFHLSASTLPKARQDRSSIRLPMGGTFAAGGPRAVSREELRDDLADPGSAVATLELMEEFEAAWIFPLIVDDHLEGILALGPKLRLRNYTRAELRKLRQVVRECALGLYSFTIREQLDEKRQAEERLRLVAHNAADVIYRYQFHPVRRLEYVSPAIERITQFPVQAFQTDPALFERLVIPEDQPALQALTQARRAESAVQLRWQRADGTVVWMEQRTVPIYDESGQLTAIEGIARDITERVKAEERRRQLETELRQSQKLEALGTFAAGVTHDFGNLTASILSYAHLVRQDLPDDSPAADLLDQVEEAALRAKGVTQSLLAFTRRSPAERKPVELCDLLRTTVRFIRSILPTGIELPEPTMPDESVWVSADESQLQQVLMNIIINARDAMPEGGVIQVGLVLRAAESHARITIADTGIGMSLEVRERVFEPFFTTKARGAGTGLGLSVSHGIILDHAGEIAIESEPGRGSRFRVELPTCREPDPQQLSPSLVDGGSQLHGSILFIARDPLVRSALAGRLSDLGLRVVEAKDLEEGLLFLSKTNGAFDLLVIDIEPQYVRDGSLCHLAAAATELSVLILTDDFADELSRALFKNSAYLSKPFAANELIKQIVIRLDSIRTGRPPDYAPQEGKVKAC